MKVFLTGANGFVGSHILEILLEMKADLVLLLRSTSDTRFITGSLPGVNIHHGSLDDPDILETAMRGVDAVIHCAGKTKALKVAQYDAVNYHGTRNVVSAANAHRNSIKHLIHISSLAVSGPGDLQRPARETEPPRPVSAYGRSKQRGEEAVVSESRVPWTVLRPAAVYGPRDADFFNVFRLMKKRIMPVIGGGKRPLSLVYVRDVARSVRYCLGREEAIGKVYHVAADPPSSDEALSQEIAGQMGIRPLRLILPASALYPLCLVQEALSQLTGRPSILSRQKVAELRAPGWVCATDQIRRDLNFEAATSLEDGVGRTLAWYRSRGWL